MAQQAQHDHLITILHPLQAEHHHHAMTKEALARKLKDSSSTFLTGVIFKGAENSGGNALGGEQWKFVCNSTFVWFMIES